jgi:hypothetical protein
MHLHILNEFEEYTATVTDIRIEKDLAANVNDATLRNLGVQEAQQLIREYQDEHAQVQNAAAQFGLYLDKNSITAYNDVTLDYLDMLIKQEKEKIEVGGDRARLEALKMDRNRHEELVAALTARMKKPHGTSDGYTVLDEAGVDAVVRKLYGLKHFGAQLKTVKNAIASAHAATYRERPYRVGSHKHYSSSRRHRGGGGGGGVSGMISSFSSMIGLSSTPSASSSKGVRSSASKSSHSWRQSSSSQSYNGSPGKPYHSSARTNASSKLKSPARQASPTPQEPPPSYSDNEG